MKLTTILALVAFLVSWSVAGGGMVAFWVLLGVFSVLVGLAGAVANG